MAPHRKTPIEISSEEFREIGYRLIDSISDHLESIRNGPVTPADKPDQLRSLLGDKSLPEHACSAKELMEKATELLMKHSLFNGHPKFMGYITSSAAPLGALADLLASAVNPNLGAHMLSPVATEIEKQTIQWLAEFIGLPGSYGGILVSGGNMANFTGFLAGRTAIASDRFKEEGLPGESGELLVYCSKATHTWIEKAATLFGHGTGSIRWIQTDSSQRMDHTGLEDTIQSDLDKGKKPMMVVGTAGDVSTGAVDHLDVLGGLCKKFNLWFHIDGAYGIPAAVLPENKDIFRGIEFADSIALDPHKWLYNPLEVGCTLVKNPKHLTDTFSSHPEYYNFSNDEQGDVLNYYEYGLQNSRGFRALKVWLTLQQVGRNGYARMIAEDIQLSDYLFELARKHKELEALTQSLSIATLRYVPKECRRESELHTAYLNSLNEELLNTLQEGGELFLSNAIVNEKYALRACIVNFRTSNTDIEEIIEVITREGARIHKKLWKKRESAISE
jgi:glutamate/tyrosine decarboxylase-like PLP-dependent enzyme